MVVDYTFKKNPPIKVNWGRTMHESWIKKLTPLLHSEYMATLITYIELMKMGKDPTFPSNKADIFKAYKIGKFDNIKVVILGNEPFTNAFGNGLAFGNYHGQKGPYSLQSQEVKKAVVNSYGNENSAYDQTLEEWQEQGVMLLNTSLLSEYGHKMSMRSAIYFRHLIRETIKLISDDLTAVVFVFTDKRQNYFKQFIDLDYHFILEEENGISDNSTVFEQINEILIDADGKGAEIEWLSND